MAYQIYRFFQNHGKRKVQVVPTLALAQEHCRDPESSSTTCKGTTGRRRTRARGPWFDGYEQIRR